MALEPWIGYVVPVIALLTFVGGIFHWLVKSYLSQLKPNGGESLSDKIRLEVIPMLKSLSEDVTDLKVDLSRLEGRFDEHASNNK